MKPSSQISRDIKFFGINSYIINGTGKDGEITIEDQVNALNNIVYVEENTTGGFGLPFIIFNAVKVIVLNKKTLWVPINMHRYRISDSSFSRLMSTNGNIEHFIIHHAIYKFDEVIIYDTKTSEFSPEDASGAYKLLRDVIIKEENNMNREEAKILLWPLYKLGLHLDINFSKHEYINIIKSVIGPHFD